MSRRTPGARGTTSARRRADPAEALYGLLSTVVRAAPRDMSLTSMATLSTLEFTGPRRVTDLAVIQGVTQPSMTALITALERSGLVERHGDASDKRVTLVAMTPVGLEYLRTRREAGRQVMAQLISKLPPDEAATLAAAVPALAHLRALNDQERDPAARL
ncbi:MAG TPA: MarR family transcriptional regulator [Jatrophihabitantaceae bacterium]